MAKKHTDTYENDFYEYKDDTDFSIYDEDLEDSVRESRRARREAKQRRKVKTANIVRPEPEEDVVEIAVEEENTEQKSPQETIQEMIPETVVLSETEIAAEEALSAVKDVENEHIRQRKTNKKKKIRVSTTANIPGEERAHKRKKKGFFSRLFRLACVVLVVYAVIVAGSWAWAYYKTTQGEPWPDRTVEYALPGVPTPTLPKVPDRTIVFLMVTDKDKTRTDAMMLANYDNVNKKLTLVSIPRDIMVEVTDENFRIMRSEYPEPAADGQVMKMNHIHHYGGEEHGVELLLSELDHQFGVTPDYWVKIDFDGFNYIVDSIGGVEFDVPQDMDYEDPSQDLYIHLKAGNQVLDGDKAQQLVRWRKDNYGHGYVNGDIDRLKVQQAFLTAFMSKALSAGTIFNNITNYMTAFQKYVSTNATISDMARYAQVLKELDMKNVETITLPCIPSPEYGEYVLDETAVDKLIYNVFEKPLDEVKKDLEIEAAEANLEKSNGKRIQILNGGYTDGMAREIMARFNEKDIDVEAVGTYNEGKPEKTTIYTAREGIGLDLVKFFYNGADVVVDPVTAGEYDIVVIVGVNEPMEENGAVVTSEDTQEYTEEDYDDSDEEQEYYDEEQYDDSDYYDEEYYDDDEEYYDEEYYDDDENWE